MLLTTVYVLAVTSSRLDEFLYCQGSSNVDEHLFVC